MENQRTLTVPGRYDEIQRICLFVADGAREAGMGEDDIFHIELCCDEAATNIIEHSYGSQDKGEITITYDIGDDSFTITLHDDGKPFDPNAVRKPAAVEKDEPQADTLGGIMDSLQIGGLGIHFMRKLMDEVHYRFEGPQGNTLILVKKIPAKG